MKKNQRGFTLIELLIVVAIIGIIAAIAIPSLLRARVSANEAALQGDIRTIISSAAAYESNNQGNGYPTALTCLSTPWGGGCIVNYPNTAPTFIDVVLATADTTSGGPPKGGYTRAYTAMPIVPPNIVPGYCYGGQPVQQNRTGVRSFGGDNSGVIGANAGGGGPVNCCIGGTGGPGQLNTDPAAGCPALK